MSRGAGTQDAGGQERDGRSVLHTPWRLSVKNDQNAGGLFREYEKDHAIETGMIESTGPCCPFSPSPRHAA